MGASNEQDPKKPADGQPGDQSAPQDWQAIDDEWAGMEDVVSDEDLASLLPPEEQPTVIGSDLSRSSQETAAGGTVVDGGIPLVMDEVAHRAFEDRERSPTDHGPGQHGFRPDLPRIPTGERQIARTIMGLGPRESEELLRANVVAVSTVPRDPARSPAQARAPEQAPVQARVKEQAPVQARVKEQAPVQARAPEQAPVQARVKEQAPAQVRAQEQAPAQAQAPSPAQAPTRTQAPAKAPPLVSGPQEIGPEPELPSPPAPSSPPAIDPLAHTDPNLLLDDLLPSASEPAPADSAPEVFASARALDPGGTDAARSGLAVAPAATSRAQPSVVPRAPSQEPVARPPVLRPQFTGKGGPSNLTLTILWVLALASVGVAVFLYAVR